MCKKFIQSVSPFIAPALALTGVGLPYAAGIGALTGGIGGGLKGALAGGLSAAGATGGGALLGSALGATGATGAAIGGGLLGAAGGAINGGGLKNALINGATSAGGAYLSAGGLSGTPSTTTNLTGNGAGAVGAGPSSYASPSSGGSWFDDATDFLGNNQLTRGLGLNSTPTNLNAGYNAGDVSTGVLSDNPAFDPNFKGFGTTQQIGNTGMNTSKYSWLSPVLSAGIGTYTNQSAAGDLLKQQQASQNLLAPFLNEQFTPGDLTQDPGYQFRLSQGQQALDRSQAARGNYFSGQALKEAQDYGQGLADSTYQDAYTRWLQTQAQKLGAAGGLVQSNDNIGNIKANALTNTGNVLTGALASALGGNGITNTGSIQGGNYSWLLPLLQQRGGIL